MEIPFPTVAAGADFAEVVVDVDATVDAAGDVTATRAATVTVHGRDDTGGSANVTPAVDASIAAALDAIRGWRFEAPVRTPASALVRVRFAAETRQATVTSINAVSGYAPTRVLRPGGDLKPPKKIANVQPIYPQEAQDLKVQGVVIIEAVIDEGGGVKEAWVVKSIPMLDEAALDAVKQWRFEPTLMNGAPIPVQITTTVNFALR